MSDVNQIDLCRAYVRKGQSKLAMEAIRRAVLSQEGGNEILNTQDPAVLRRFPPELISYYGLCLVLTERRVQRGTLLCKTALGMDMFRSELYLNLGKVYLQSGERVKAIEILRKGLNTTDQSGELAMELKKMGVRGKPPIPFLPRSFFLNKYLGKFLYALKGNKSGKNPRR
jgi:tetratricopeptide (TPR) repeat protein